MQKLTVSRVAYKYTDTEILEHMLNLPLKVSKDFCKDSALHMTIVSFFGLK